MSLDKTNHPALSPLLVDCRLNHLGSNAVFNCLVFRGAREKHNNVAMLCSTCVISSILSADVESTPVYATGSRCLQFIEITAENPMRLLLLLSVFAVVRQ